MKNGEQVVLRVPAGRHRLVIVNGRHRSNEIRFDVDASGELGVRVAPPYFRVARFGPLSRFAPVVQWERVNSGARVATDSIGWSPD